MANALVCWKCGASIEEQPLPLGRRAECFACHTELHTCRMCQFFDPTVSQSCREPIADNVPDKKRANFCGYFQIKPGAFHAQENGVAGTAQSQLDALFGGDTSVPDPQAANTDSPLSGEALAKQQLENLFKK